jgi:hypothetical protein
MVITAGHQPNYLPWLGFFDKMAKSDIFIIEDDFLYEHNGFINRNRIKTMQGAKWLTVPVRHAGYQQPINQIRIANSGEPDWANRHWLTLKHNYIKAPYWDKYSGFFEETYSQKWDRLIDLNLHLIKGLMRFLKIEKPLIMSSNLETCGKKSDLILAQCKAINADIQLSGAGAKNYIQTNRFEENGIKVVFQDFKYPQYRQLQGNFIPNLSVVDYLFCTGECMLDEKTKKCPISCTVL